MKFISLICLLLFFVSCNKEENTLYIYSSLDAKETSYYIKHFEKDTGIKVKWVRMSTGETLARLMAEKNSPQVSVWFGGSSPEFIVAGKKGLLEAYRPKNKTVYLPNQRDPNWFWTGIYFGAIGFASNKEQLKKLNIKPPTSWSDLLKPEFKGKISMAYPYTSGTAYTIVSSILQQKGLEKGWDFIEQLNQQIHHYNKSGSAAVTQVGLGEIAIGISFSHDILKKGKSAGYPIELTFPKEGTGSEIGAMAMVKGGKHPKLAKKFLDYFSTTKGQQHFIKFFRVGLDPENRVPDTLISKQDIKLSNFDVQKAANEQPEIIKEWKKRTQR
jgi:iron(III) transport system substrate-binding protein